jgi:hypothetical protein
MPGSTRGKTLRLIQKSAISLPFLIGLPWHFTCDVNIEGKRMKSQKLRYYMHDGPSAFRFELAGDLDNEGAHELEQAYSST